MQHWTRHPKANVSVGSVEHPHGNTLRNLECTLIYLLDYLEKYIKFGTLLILGQTKLRMDSGLINEQVMFK